VIDHNTHPPPITREGEFPYWLLAIGLMGAAALVAIFASGLYWQIFTTVSKGVWITVSVTLFGFLFASALGLLLAVMQLSGSLAARQVARFYIEVMRGIPALVLLLYVAFVGAPTIVAAINFLLGWAMDQPMRTRDFPLAWRASFALMLAYSPFIAEVFRAGIQAVDSGQQEAAKALGLSPWQRFRFIVFPQAIRTIAPPLGNDFIAMTKDSSLVSVLGVADITQIGKIYAAGSFRYFETYNVVALVYLLLTVSLSLALRRLEKRLKQKGG
jgi:His/Glu/Gln/Arg/opine family amino acid ABC transporter permease subunit